MSEIWIVFTDIEHDDYSVISVESSDTYSDHGMSMDCIHIRV